MEHQAQFKICNTERDMELSNRITDRNRPIGYAGLVFDPRPTPTKYTDFQVLNPPDRTSTGLVHPVYDVSKVFRGGDKRGPWSGFAAKINTESSLRNQFFALQSCEQSSYVPSTDSDMYTAGGRPPPPFPRGSNSASPKLVCLR